MNRRKFLAIGSAAGLPGRVRSAQAGTDGLRLGVCTYSLRNFPRAKAIAMVRQLNVGLVSVKEMHLPYKGKPEEWTAGCREFEAAGLTIASGGVIYIQKDDDAEIRFYFEYAKACGMPMMVVGATHQTLHRIEKMVKAYGISVAIHNHGPEDREFPNPQAALKAIESMDPRVGVCVDAGHTARTGVDIIETIRIADRRLLDFHIKDLRDLKDAKSQVPVGDGAMPVAAIFRELRRMKYPGVVGLEYEIDGDDPLPGMQKSFAHMRGVLAGQNG